MCLCLFDLLTVILNSTNVETMFCSGFTSIPQGMWWAVQTLTSLGYGDFTPTTTLGKLVGSACAVSGVLVMALPIPIVVDNFADYYKEQKKIEAKELKKEAQDAQTEVDIAVAKVANEGLVDMLAMQSGAAEMFPDDPDLPATQNGILRK